MQTKDLSSYEDLYQNFLANVILDGVVKPENIRPTRQKQFNPLIVPNPDFDEEEPITATNPQYITLQPENNLVLFFIRQDTGGSSRPYVKDSTKSYHLREWSVDIAVYGEDSLKIVNMIKQGHHLSKALRHLNSINFVLGDFDQMIYTTDLLINNRWYKQRRYNCTYNEVVETELEHLEEDFIESVGSANITK